jgi:hypothetical protein
MQLHFTYINSTSFILVFSKYQNFICISQAWYWHDLIKPATLSPLLHSLQLFSLQYSWHNLNLCVFSFVLLYWISKVLILFNCSVVLATEIILKFTGLLSRNKLLCFYSSYVHMEFIYFFTELIKCQYLSPLLVTSSSKRESVIFLVLRYTGWFM